MSGLPSLLAPARTALIVCEMQRGIMGDLALSAPLRTACETERVAQTCAALAASARRVGVRVVHSWLVMRGDLAGTAFNTPIMRGARKRNALVIEGSERAQPVAGLEPHPEDIISTHCFGVTPFASRDLDQMMRNIGVSTLICAGVSLNEGIAGLCIAGADLGYEVVLPTDATTGTPSDYKAAMLEHTFNLLATITDSTTIAACWDNHRTQAVPGADRRQEMPL